MIKEWGEGGESLVPAAKESKTSGKTSAAKQHYAKLTRGMAA